ncbi:MAG: tellurium resistance protein TerC [Pseudomonadota bacterium]
MLELLTFENLANLFVLLFLQAVLGFDNLLYISIESQRAPAEKQASVRRNGILIAIALRIVLLWVMVHLLASLTEPFFSIQWAGVIEGSFNFATIVFLFGGVFLMYTAIKEISHLLTIEDLSAAGLEKTKKSAASVIALIVFMNLIFSFDSILSALAITEVFPILAIAIISSGIAMLVLADKVSEFLEKNRKYEVLGLFILLIVGIVLLGEGGHQAHLKLFGYAVEPLSKSTFYFSIVVLVAVDIIQSGYQRKLARQRALQRTNTVQNEAQAQT